MGIESLDKKPHDETSIRLEEINKKMDALTAEKESLQAREEFDTTTEKDIDSEQEDVTQDAEHMEEVERIREDTKRRDGEKVQEIMNRLKMQSTSLESEVTTHEQETPEQVPYDVGTQPIENGEEGVVQTSPSPENTFNESAKIDTVERKHSIKEREDAIREELINLRDKGELTAVEGTKTDTVERKPSIKDREDAIREELIKLRDDKELSAIFENNSTEDEGIDKIALKNSLEELDSYKDMEKRPFWRHLFDNFLDSDGLPVTNPLVMGGTSAAVYGVGLTTLGIGGASVALGPAIATGALIGIATGTVLRALAGLRKTLEDRG